MIDTNLIRSLRDQKTISTLARLNYDAGGTSVFVRYRSISAVELVGQKRGDKVEEKYDRFDALNRIGDIRSHLEEHVNLDMVIYARFWEKEGKLKEINLFSYLKKAKGGFDFYNIDGNALRRDRFFGELEYFAGFSSSGRDVSWATIFFMGKDGYQHRPNHTIDVEAVFHQQETRRHPRNTKEAIGNRWKDLTKGSFSAQAHERYVQYLFETGQLKEDYVSFNSGKLTLITDGGELSLAGSGELTIIKE